MRAAPTGFLKRPPLGPCTTFPVDSALHRVFCRHALHFAVFIFALFLGIFSSPGGIRTPDQGIMSPLL